MEQQAGTQIALQAPYNPGLLVTGVSYRTLSVEWREKLTQRVPQPEVIAQTIVSRIDLQSV